MTPQEHQRARELFEQASALPPDQRDDLLTRELNQAVAREVRDLLAAGEATSEQPPAGDTAQPAEGPLAPLRDMLNAAIDLPQGSRIGPYVILERLGEGGFGAVYKAEQRSPIKRTVALKIIKPGLDTKDVLARFESERQALARMEHPNIAKVLDAGTTDTGRPYFVMEFVPGLSVTTFADQHKLSIPQRLELFMQVCDAITHAHQKAIIHRDIKPGNVLAFFDAGKKPTAKVIDFGIAKALTTDKLTDRTFNTASGAAIGTYESMSPEQADGDPDVDTRTDVYSLGVLLYELLTGVKPFDFGNIADQEIRRVIREVDPPAPSTRLTKLGGTGTKLAERRQMRIDQLSRELRSELEWIPLKAMRKERERRYASPEQLKEDVQNYLDGAPLIAGPESRVYVLKKWANRHRPQLLTAAAVLALIIGGVTAYVVSIRAEQRRTLAAKVEAENQRNEAVKQKAAAEQKQKESEAVVDFINTDVFAGATPGRMPDTKVRDEIVKKMLEPAAKAVREKFKDQPLVEAAVMNQIAHSFESLGRSAEAEPLYRDALERRRRVLGEDHPYTIASINNYAKVLQSLGRSAEAEPLYKHALERRRRVLGEDHRDTIESVHNYAGVLQRLGRSAEAEPLFKDALERCRQVLGEDHPGTLLALNNYAVVLRSLGRSAEAEPLFKDALERSRRVLGEDYPDTLLAINNYASELNSLGRSAEAEPLSKDALERRRRVLGEDHPDTIASINNYARVLTSLGRSAEAEPLYKDALERHRRVLGEDHPGTLLAINNYASVLQSLGRVAEAEPLYKDALERRRQVLGEDHPNTITSIHNYAYVLQSLGRSAEAGPLARRAVWLATGSKSLGPKHPNTRAFARTLARILVANGKPDEARAVAAEFGLPDPTTQPAATQPTTQPLDDARVAEIRAFVAKLEAEWAQRDRAAATQPVVTEPVRRSPE